MTSVPAQHHGSARWLATAVALLGSVCLVVAGALPIWGTRLIAPQYPGGLDLWFYGGRVEGPLREVNGLNHYIGMRPIDLAVVPELALWPVAVVGSTVLLLVALFGPSWLGRLASSGLFLVPVIVLADIQRWLIIFGSQLDRTSALRLDPFVPLVIGPSTVWNFTVWTFPGPALALIWAVGALSLVGRRASRSSTRAALTAGAMALTVALVGTVFVVLPGVQPADPPAVAVPRDPPAGSLDLAGLVEAAPSGATVVVPAGAYRVHLVIDRPLTLVADGEVLLDGGGRGTVLTIAAPDVTVRGFRLAHTGGQVEEAAAIKAVDADRVTIEGNRIEDAFTGIAVEGGSSVRIIGNEVVGSGQVASDVGHVATSGATPADADPHAQHGEGGGPGGQGDGIALWNVRGALVRDNVVRDVRDGVYLNYVDEALLDGNRVERSRFAVHAMFGMSVTVFGNEIRGNLSGLVLMYTSGVLAGRNVIVDARSPGTGFGVVVKDVTTMRLAENLIARNRVGLQAEGTVNRLDAEASVVSNRFAANDVGVALMPSADLVFGGNVFDANLAQVTALGVGTERRNYWSYRGVGNTWSDYAGYDLTGDGIGDVPYRAGGVEGLLVVADPALAALRTSPAMAILASAQAVWEGARPPVVLDHSPRTQQVGAAVAPGEDPGSAGGEAWWLGGAGLLIAAVAGVVLPSRTARPRAMMRGELS